MVDPRVFELYGRKDWVGLFRLLAPGWMKASLEAIEALVARGFVPNPNLYRAELERAGRNEGGQVGIDARRMELMLAVVQTTRNLPNGSAMSWEKFQEMYLGHLNALPPQQQIEIRDFWSPAETASAANAQDFYVRMSGYNNPGEQGADLSGSSDAAAFLKEVNTPAYLAQHPPVLVIWKRGSAVPVNDRSGEVVQQVLAKATPGSRVFLSGGSAGGNNALFVAMGLSRKVNLELVAICDGAFQNKDDSPTNQVVPTSESPLTFKPKGNINARRKNNFYQSWGHTLDPTQELHGKLEGFTNIDLTNSPEVMKVRQEFDSNIIALGRDKQKALAGAHVAAYAEGFKRSEELIKAILKS